MENIEPVVKNLEEWMEVSLHHSMRDFIRFAKEKDLSMSQFGALLNIYHAGTCGVSDLGDVLGVTSAASSQMLERLVRQGLITRSEDPNDRRVKNVVLTEDGKNLIQESFFARQAWLGDLAEMLSMDQRDQVLFSLQVLTDKAKQLIHRQVEKSS